MAHSWLDPVESAGPSGARSFASPRSARAPPPASSARHRHPARAGGEHTLEVLRELGFDAARIERLRSDGVIP